VGSLVATAAACALAPVAAESARAVATIAADTTRAPLRDPLAAGRAPTLVAGGLDRTLLRFAVKGIGGPPARAVLRLRVTDPTFESLAVRVLPAGFGELDGTPSLLARARPDRARERRAGRDVGAVRRHERRQGRRRCRPAGVRTAARRRELLVARGARRAAARRHARRRPQATLAALPDSGFVVAFERDTPDPRWVSTSSLVVRQLRRLGGAHRGRVRPPRRPPAYPRGDRQSAGVITNFGTWRLYLYDRERDEARMLALRLPAGSWAIGNPTVRTLTVPDGQPRALRLGLRLRPGRRPGRSRSVHRAAPARLVRDH
jgi:hypothetical protein